ncbi:MULTISPECIES: GNAT family N-acetyltransferase [Streptomyces]|uniref:GNAT family N-acetyltransferase n=1 Tax=Streptomyces silvae TaxID=2803812 RepID=A0ABU8A7E8_9ACTN|nr:GNAT family N-acetyltransferase [Streptomyces sp. ME02-6979-3A]MDX3328403.1 GNAT family N-acetyltransferase [Streptomyces sp. ME02-6979-3A]
MSPAGELLTPEGLSLRPWRAGDAPAVLRAFAPEEMARQAGRPVTTTAEALGWIAARESERQAGSAYTWAVVRDGVPLGAVAVAAVNHVHDTGWVSYWTVEAARGTGIAVAGVRALARWAFDDLGLHRLELGHRTNNPASCAVAMRAGFAAEGIERQKLRYGDTRYDVERHARLADDDVNQG